MTEDKNGSSSKEVIVGKISGRYNKQHEDKLLSQAMGKGCEVIRTIMDSVGDAIVFLKGAEIVECNEAAFQIFGIKNKEEFLGHSILEFLPPSQIDGRSSAEMVEEITIAVRNKQFHPFQLRHIRKDGTPFEAEVSLGGFELEGEPYIKAIVRDVTEKMNRERRLARINRALKTLSEGNQMLVRAGDEESLLNGICEVVVEHGGYPFAWVGFAEKDKKKTVRPVAFAGKEEGYLNTVQTTWGDDERGQGPTGRAIRTKKPQFVRDIRTDPGYAPWREEAVKRGFLSSIALPLVFEDEVFGALNIYAEETDAFDTEEIELLMEMAKDLAYGIHALRIRVLHQRAEEALRKSEKKYRLLVETAREAIILHDMDGKIQFINSGGLWITGLKREEVVGKNIIDLFKFNEKVSMLSLQYMRKKGKKDVFYYEIHIDDQRHKRIPLEVTSAPVIEDGKITGELIIARDISRQKEAEENIRKTNEKIEKLLEVSAALGGVQSKEKVYQIALKTAKDILEFEVATILIALRKYLKIVMTTDSTAPPGYLMSIDEGIAGRTYRNQKSFLVNDVGEDADAKPTNKSFRSTISIPIGRFGVFQAHSTKKYQFNSDDQRIAELLISHVIEALKRIDKEEKVKRSEERYRKLFNESPISIWEEDFSKVKKYLDRLKDSVDGNLKDYLETHPEEVAQCISQLRVIDVNERTLEMYKAEKKSELISNIEKIFDKDSMPMIINELMAIAEGKTKFKGETVNQTLDGEKLNVIVKWAVVPGHEEDFSRILFSVIDLTEQKEAEEIRLLLETGISQSYNMVVITDPDGNIQYVNPVFEEITGYSFEEVLGKNLRILKSGKHDRRFYAKLWGTILSGETWKGHFINKRKDGTLYHERAIISPVMDSTGKIINFIAVKENITELVEAEERYRTLFEESLDAIYITSKEGKVIEFNPAALKLFGYTHEEVAEHRVEELYVNHADRERFRQEIEKNGYVKNFEVKLKKKDGTVMDCLLTTTVKRDPNGKVIGYQGIIRDITEQKRAAEELERYRNHLEELVEEKTAELREATKRLIEQEKLATLGSLSGHVAQEIRHPMTVIKNAVYLTLKRLGPEIEHNPDIQKYRDMVLDEIDKANGVINDMLDITQEVVPLRRPTDPGEVIEEVVSTLPPHDGVEISEDLEPGLIRVLVDPKHLRKILNELIDNSIQAIQQSGDGTGRVIIRTEKEKDEKEDDENHTLRLSVMDTGPGIPEEVRQRIFEPLFSTRPRGMGLGLYTVKRLIEADGLKFNVESKPGNGTTFTILLPLIEQGNGEE